MNAAMLGHVPLFATLPRGEIDHLARTLPRLAAGPGELLFSEGEHGDCFYVVLTGEVEIVKALATVDERVVGIRGSGEFVGELSLVDNIPRSASVISLEPCTLLWISRTTFGECLGAMPLMALNLVQILARRLRVATTQVQLLTAQDIYGRVAHLLLRLAEEYGEPLADGAVRIPLRLTQSDLAGLAGSSRARQPGPGLLPRTWLHQHGRGLSPDDPGSASAGAAILLSARATPHAIIGSSAGWNIRAIRRWRRRNQSAGTRTPVRG